MPTLVRLLTTILFIATVVLAIMVALVVFVEPRRTPIVVDVPLKQLQTGAPLEAARP